MGPRVPPGPEPPRLALLRLALLRLARPDADGLLDSRIRPLSLSGRYLAGGISTVSIR
jgi:hypothetical protein